jgi:asparagine synthase (glutamine-hydrolysing)
VIFWEVPRERLRESDIGIQEAAKLVRETLDDAVRIRLRADVPLAIELSGGVDSSTVLALAARHHPDRLTTYTVKYPDARWDEEPFARSVASRYNVDYRVLEPDLGGFWRQLLAFTYLQEEPYHSPNMHVSQVIWQLMREAGTKVTLTGAAGDELFAGYAAYYWKAQIENLLTGRWGHFIDNARHRTDERPEKWLGLARELVAGFGMRPLVRRVKELVPALENQFIRGLSTPRKQYHHVMLSAWLREDVVNTLIPYWLRSGEKNYMGIPFEARCPFLDYRVVDVATQLPTTYLLRHGWHKWILRKAMEDLLPAEVVWRRVKMGFPYPYERFFATYRPLVELILSEARNPYINPDRYEQLMTDWHGLSFILWYEFFINDNKALFRKIETMAAATGTPAVARYTPEFLNTRTFDLSAADTVA